MFTTSRSPVDYDIKRLCLGGLCFDFLCGLSVYGQLDCSGRVSTAQYGCCDINESAEIKRVVCSVIQS